MELTRSRVRRVFQEVGGAKVFASRNTARPWDAVGEWPCRWIHLPETQKPFVGAFRCDFEVGEGGTTSRVRVTGDERYELYLDGVRVGRGPERGDRWGWFYETYEMELADGHHTLVARVWALGRDAPWAQASVRPGLMVCPEDEAGRRLMGTGIAAGPKWEAKRLPGYSFRSGSEQTGEAMGVGTSFDVDGRVFPWMVEAGMGEGWDAVEVGVEGNEGFWMYVNRPVAWLVPGTLPAMRDAENEVVSGVLVRHALVESEAKTDGPYQVVQGRHDARVRATVAGLLRGREMVVERGKTLRAVIDLDDYVCCYPQLVVSGGRDAVVEIEFAESLFAEPTGREKGNRDEMGGAGRGGGGGRGSGSGGSETGTRWEEGRICTSRCGGGAGGMCC